MALNIGEKNNIIISGQLLNSKYFFSDEYKIDKSLLFAHILRPDRATVCLAYEPLGPTIKSWDGVKYHIHFIYA